MKEVISEILADFLRYITIHHLFMMAILFLQLQYLQYLYSQIDHFLTVSEVPVLGEVDTPGYHIKHIMYSVAAIVYHHVSKFKQFRTKQSETNGISFPDKPTKCYCQSLSHSH